MRHRVASYAETIAACPPARSRRRPSRRRVAASSRRPRERDHVIDLEPVDPSARRQRQGEAPGADVGLDGIVQALRCSRWPPSSMTDCSRSTISTSGAATSGDDGRDPGQRLGAGRAARIDGRPLAGRRKLHTVRPSAALRVIAALSWADAEWGPRISRRGGVAWLKQVVLLRDDTWASLFHDHVMSAHSRMERAGGVTFEALRVATLPLRRAVTGLTFLPTRFRALTNTAGLLAPYRPPSRCRSRGIYACRPKTALDFPTGRPRAAALAAYTPAGRKPRSIFLQARADM
jgi:hypothetical protein